MEGFMSDHIYSLVHWPFLAFAVVAMLVNQVIKSAIFTKARAHLIGPYQWFYWWAWKSLPLQPVIVGVIVGFIWNNPEGTDPIWSWQASVSYFALAGALSVWLYQILKGLAKKRGFDIGTFPGSGGREC